MSVAAVKKNFLDVIKDITEEDSTVTVTKNGVAVCIIITPDRYVGLLETIEALSNPAVRKALDASEGDFKAGKVYSHKEVWAD